MRLCVVYIGSHDQKYWLNDRNSVVKGRTVHRFLKQEELENKTLSDFDSNFQLSAYLNILMSDHTHFVCTENPVVHLGVKGGKEGPIINFIILLHFNCSYICNHMNVLLCTSSNI